MSLCKGRSSCKTRVCRECPCARGGRRAKVAHTWGARAPCAKRSSLYEVLVQRSVLVQSGCVTAALQDSRRVRESTNHTHTGQATGAKPRARGCHGAANTHMKLCLVVFIFIHLCKGSEAVWCSPCQVFAGKLAVLCCNPGLSRNRAKIPPVLLPPRWEEWEFLPEGRNVEENAETKSNLYSQ